LGITKESEVVLSLSAEISEFVTEVTGKMHPDEPWNVQLHHVVREGFDIVGVLLDAGNDVDELSNEAVAAASAILAKANLGPVAKRIANSALPWILPPLVEQLAAYAGTAQEFVDTHVIPRLDRLIETLIDVRSDLANDPTA
jgi:hypothetical protein